MGESMNTYRDMCELAYWIERADVADTLFDMDEFLDAGVSPKTGARWHRTGVPAEIARDFERLGLSVDEALAWSLVPDVVAEFMAFDFDAVAAREWRDGPQFEAVEAAAWRDAGFDPFDAQVMDSLSPLGLAAVLPLLMSGMRPSEAVAAISASAPEPAAAR